MRTATASDRQKALDSAIAQIERQYGKGSLMKLDGAGVAGLEVNTISTGSLGLDIALGVGGMPRGRICEIYGPESSGKTTMTLELIAQAQKQGLNCAFLDAEHALDTGYAEKLGVRLEDLYLSQPDHGEQALGIADTLARSGAMDVIIVDSVAALTPKSELDGDIGDSSVGVQARMMSQAMRKLNGVVKTNDVLMVFINQIRMKIGVMFGSPETTTGGNALKFYSSVRLDIRRTGSLKDRDTPIGNTTRVKVVKNKVAPPFREANFDIMFGTGVSYEGELIDLGIKHGVVQKSGSWLSYGDTRIGQGKEKARALLAETPDVASEIDAKIRAAAMPDATASDDDPTSATPPATAAMAAVT